MSAGVEWWALEDSSGHPMALGNKPLVFSRRDLASQHADKAGLTGARIVRYAGDSDVIGWLVKVAALGAEAVLVDHGTNGGCSFRIRPETWDAAAIRRARDRASGLEVVA